MFQPGISGRGNASWETDRAPMAAPITCESMSNPEPILPNCCPAVAVGNGSAGFSGGRPGEAGGGA